MSLMVDKEDLKNLFLFKFHVTNEIYCRDNFARSSEKMTLGARNDCVNHFSILHPNIKELAVENRKIKKLLCVCNYFPSSLFPSSCILVSFP